jgi:hypothetical protein
VGPRDILGDLEKGKPEKWITFTEIPTSLLLAHSLFVTAG